jgi:Putative glycosyl hydrolase domain/Peptidase C39 family
MVTDPNLYDQIQNYQILRADFKLMITAVNNYAGTPTKVYIRKNGVKLAQYITWAKYKDDLIIRWDKYVTDNKVDPNYIWINTPKPPTPTPIPTPTPGGGRISAYWVRSSVTNMLTVDPQKYINQGITDLYVGIDRTTYKTFLPQVINRFKGTGVNIHAWMTTFKDINGNFISPKNWETTIITGGKTLIQIVKDLATISGLKGIHFDYIRYPGNASGDSASITNFCKAARVAAPKLTLSAALMPETSDAQAYGQDPKGMALSLDYLCPMIYRCTYANTDRAWMSKMAGWFNSQAPGKIVAGVCSYVSDTNATPYSAFALNGDIKAVLDAGAIGFAIFRDGVSNYDGAFKVGTPIPAPNPNPQPIPVPVSGCYTSTRIEEVHQKTGYTCGPTSSVMALYELGIIETEADMAKLEGTTTNGTGHPGLASGIIAAAAKFGVKVEVTFKRFVDVGWDGLGKIVADPNVACIIHGQTSGWPTYYVGSYGHYVVPVEVCTATSRIRIADPARDLIWYNFAEFKRGMDLISQPSVCIITKV